MDYKKLAAWAIGGVLAGVVGAHGGAYLAGCHLPPGLAATGIQGAITGAATIVALLTQSPKQ